MKYIRLPNGNKMKCYDCVITNACILKFINSNLEEIKNFLGTDIIDYIDVFDENDEIIASHDLYMKRKGSFVENTEITKYEHRIVKEAYTETVTTTNENGKNISQQIRHPEEIETIEKKVPVEMITVYLEKPDITEEIDNIKQTIGISNPNNMTLEEFKAYYKNIIGEKCRKVIYDGIDIVTSLGKKHFSYTLEDQSNVKDLYTVLEASDFTLSLPYHADGEDCKMYTANDITEIYTALSGHKLYHTTYCNILNTLINQAPDLNSVKSITYGMELPDKYQTVINTLLNAGQIAINLMSAKCSADV